MGRQRHEFSKYDDNNRCEAHSHTTGRQCRNFGQPTDTGKVLCPTHHGPPGRTNKLRREHTELTARVRELEAILHEYWRLGGGTYAVLNTPANKRFIPEFASHWKSLLSRTDVDTKRGIIRGIKSEDPANTNRRPWKRIIPDF